MKNSNYKLMATNFIIILLISLIAPKISLAALCDGVDYANPTPVQILCPLIKIINILILASGGVFIIMVIFSAYKYLTSLGDPKGAMGANLTLFYATAGLGAILFSFVIIKVIAGFFGLDENIIVSPEEVFKQEYCDMLNGLSRNGIPPIEDSACQ